MENTYLKPNPLRLFKGDELDEPKFYTYETRKCFTIRLKFNKNQAVIASEQEAPKIIVDRNVLLYKTKEIDIAPKSDFLYRLSKLFGHETSIGFDLWMTSWLSEITIKDYLRNAVKTWLAHKKSAIKRKINNCIFRIYKSTKGILTIKTKAS